MRLSIIARLKRLNPITIARNLQVLIIPLGTLMVFTAVGVWTTQPPAPSTSDIDFSVNRAMEHVRQIAHEPHPVGSAAHGRVLNYLQEQLRALPLDVQVQDAVVNNLRLTNVLATPKNASGSNVVLLVAHYDSVSTGPGAGDDGAGVATLLETARLACRESAAKNEIAFLFTDGEENGGLPGSEAFVENNSEFLKRVKLVLNFDARGNRGPVIMYETGPRNLELIRLLRACPYPMATSFAQDVYRRMPNDTDFSHFLDAGLTGYNFAMIMGVEVYHRPGDTPENLDRRSLAHYGSYALTLARRLSQMDLDSLRGSDDGVFFTPIRGLLMVYPASWAGPLAIGACVLYALIISIFLIRRQMSIGRFLLGIVFVTAICALAFGLGKGGLSLIAAAFHGHWLGLTPGPSTADSITVVFMLVTTIVVLTIKSWLSRRFGAKEMLAGSLLVWLVLAVLTAFELRGFSYLLLWPAVSGTLALMILSRQKLSVGYATTLCTLIPGCLLFAPTMLLAYHALGIALLPGLVTLAAFQVFLIHVPAMEAQR